MARAGIARPLDAALAFGLRPGFGCDSNNGDSPENRQMTVKPLVAAALELALLTGHQRPSMPPGALPCQRVGHSLLVEATINDTTRGWFLVDTGAGGSAVAQESLDVAGLRPYGSVDIVGAGGTRK